MPRNENPISNPRIPYLSESAPIINGESDPMKNAIIVIIPSAVERCRDGTTSKSEAWEFTSKSPLKTPYAATAAHA